MKTPLRNSVPGVRHADLQMSLSINSRREDIVRWYWPSARDKDFDCQIESILFNSFIDKRTLLRDVMGSNREQQLVDKIRQLLPDSKKKYTWPDVEKVEIGRGDRRERIFILFRRINCKIWPLN